MTSPNMYARYDGLNRAHKRPDAETFRLLEEISLQDEQGNLGCVHERGCAIIALARCEKWTEFIRAVVFNGFLSPAEIADERIVTFALDDAAMAPAFALLDGPEPAVGAILAVGLGQRKDKVDTLCDLLERAPYASATAQACVQALGYLGDCGDRVVPLLEAQLTIPHHYRAAWIALLRNGSDAAIDALVTRLTEFYDQHLAINLLQCSRAAEAVTRLMRAFLTVEKLTQSSDNWQFQELTVYVQDRALLNDVLQGEAIQERVRKSATAADGAVRFSGARAAAISALSVSDRVGGYETALAILRSPDAPGRELYPELLLQLDEERAIIHLLEQMTNEKETAVRWAIGRILSAYDLMVHLEDKFLSQYAHERTMACQIAGYQPENRQLEQALKRCLHDTSDIVMRTAETALRQLGATQELNVLINAYLSENDSAKRWFLLDIILDCGDPGEEGNNLPTWIHRLCEGMSHLTYVYVRKRISEKQKERAQEARSNDFFSTRY